MWNLQSRRQFVAGLTAFGAAAWAVDRDAHADEGPPETTRVRFPVFINISDCQAPLNVAGELLRAEGITGVEFVSSGTGPDSSDWLEHGEIDFDWNFPPVHVRSLAKGVPLKVLTGLHVGCLELFANDGIKGIPDLKGKRFGVDAINGVSYLLLNIVASYVGLDPAHDFEWITTPDPVKSFTDGEIDAFFGTPPQPQIMRERKLGRVVLNTAVDRPWSQYFCCMLAGRAEFVERNPIATKRILRAVLKAVDLCITDPEAVARGSVAMGFSASYDYVRQALGDARYDVWREYDPEDSLRFYALRMNETKAISASPSQIIRGGTDWSLLNELKRELKS